MKKLKYAVLLLTIIWSVSPLLEYGVDLGSWIQSFVSKPAYHMILSFATYVFCICTVICFCFLSRKHDGFLVRKWIYLCLLGSSFLRVLAPILECIKMQEVGIPIADILKGFWFSLFTFTGVAPHLILMGVVALAITKEKDLPQ